MKYFVLLVLILVGWEKLSGKNNEFIFEQISPEAGFAFDAIGTICEDENGLIWFGCSNGLHSYNTQEINRYNFDPKNDQSPPSNNINKLYLDNNKVLWICTDNGICYFNKTLNSFTRVELREINSYQKYRSVTQLLQYTNNEYLIVINDSLFSFDIGDGMLKNIKVGEESETAISFLGQGDDGRIYLGTVSGEVFVNNTPKTEFRLLYQSGNSAVKTICTISSNLWIGYLSDGVDEITPAGQLISRYRQEYKGNKHLPNNRVRKIIKRKDGEIWIGTYSGILLIAPGGNKTITQNSYNKLPHNSIYDLITDQNDGIWIGTWSGGLAYYSDYNYRFEHVQKLKDLMPDSRSVISSFSETSGGETWLGSESLGLFKYDSKNRSIRKVENPDGLNSVLRIKSMATDHKNRLWIGTFYQGLWYLDPQSKKLIRAKLNVRSVMDIISSITPDGKGLWIGSRGQGLTYYNPDDETHKTYNYEELKTGSISSDRIWKTYLDSKGNLWICSDFGLSVKPKDSESFERFFYNENANSLSRNKTFSICEDNGGNMWIGTNGGGINIYDPIKKAFQKLNTNSVLDNLDIYSILRDHNGNMWMSTDKGIHVYHTKTKTLKSYTEEDGLQGNQFNPNSAYINSAGQLFFGGSNGFNIINPKTGIDNPIVPDVFVSKFLINNLPVAQQPVKFVDALHLSNIGNIELSHHQNSFIFSFVTNNYIKASKNKFRYRLKNYQDEWIETSSNKEVSYTKVPPGKYILQLYGSNNDGVFNTKAKEVFIRIYPPFWLSWYAYLLYSVITGAVLFLVIKEIAFRERVRKEIISERFKREADEMLFSEKTRFFTNVSHEFRTPLTLIISPLNSLMKKFSSDAITMEHFKTMKRNADRLLRLTNQMLDFRLLELGKIKMNPEKNEIVNICKEICECFDHQIIEKEINFIFTSSFKRFEITIDSDMIEKVVYNLLSNALKFSPEKGQIILSIEQKSLLEASYDGFYCTGSKFMGNSLEIKVKDHGKGIDPAVVPQIFDRFFMNPDNQATGTGIGLHLCQEYIRLHDGNILVSSEIGQGTTFIINIPVKNQLCFEKENIVIQAHLEKLPDIITSKQSDFSPSHKSKIILLAEDSDELRIYLRNFLMGGFKVLTAKNGSQAYEIATEVIPDLIISDILMPGMDGLQLTSHIRKNSKTSHIPVILLTALSGHSVQLDSVNMGADLFLTKPIDETLLLAQIENILANRDNLAEKYATNNATPFQTGNKFSFIERAEKYILDNIRNEQLDINMLAKELNISRSSLHRKIKTDTNQSSTEFIRDIRLKYAIRLMNDNTYNMDEIAVLTGFNSTSWFNRCFKQKYGKTPKEYKNKLKNY